MAAGKTVYDHSKVVSDFPQVPNTLKEKQSEVLKQLVDQKRHVCAVLPTGYGKSLLFVLPALFTGLVTLVISPLLSLMNNQCHQLREWGVRCICLNEHTTEEELSDIGNVHVVLATPESILGGHYKRLLQIKNTIGLLCFDEAHVLYTWGKTFRPTLQRLGKLRSVVTEARALLLTATLTQHILESILHALHIQDIAYVSASIDRPNIELEIRLKTPKSDDLQWLLDLIVEKGRETPKTIIFARSAITLTNLFHRILIDLWEHAYGNKVWGDSDQLLLEIFQSELFVDDHHRILSEFKKPDSVIRVIFSTDCLALGVHFPDIRFVVHWGTPESLLHYWQQAGRAGRDGLPAKSILYGNGRTFKGRQECVKTLLKTCKSMTCARDSILKHLYIHGMDPITCASAHHLQCCTVFTAPPRTRTRSKPVADEDNPDDDESTDNDQEESSDNDGQ